MIFYKHIRKREESYRRLRRFQKRIAQLKKLCIRKIVYSRIAQLKKSFIRKIVYSHDALTFYYILYNLLLSNLLFSSSKLFLMNASSKIDTEILKQSYDSLFDDFMNLSNNCTFEAKNIKTIEFINSFNSSKIDDNISVTSKTSKKRKYKMKNFVTP